MRILAQALVAARGGSVTVLRDFIASWPTEDDLLVICWRPEAAEILAATGVPVVTVRARSTESALVRLALDRPQSLRGFDPDVVWSQATLMPRCSVPQAIHHQDIGSFTDLHPPTLRQRLKLAQQARDLRRADLTITNSEVLRRAIAERHPEVGRTVVIRNGFDLRPFDDAASDPEAPHTTPHVLVPQTGAPHKRNALVADVLAALLEDPLSPFARVRLTVAGFGDYRDLRSRLLALRLPVSAEFTGYVSRAEMAGLYASANAVLITSAGESFCNPIIEAHAAGRPVVTAPFPVARELAGPMSLVATSFQANALAAELRHALEPARWTAAVRAAGRRHAHRFLAEQQAATLRAELAGLRHLGHGPAAGQSAPWREG
ncbi:MAG: mannosyltransferase [Planctomycetota bacterium]